MVQRTKISTEMRRQVEVDADHRCSYCLSPAVVGIPMLVDHIISLAVGGTSTLANLCLSCYRCNEFKNAAITGVDPLTGKAVALFHPRQQKWSQHFAWSDNGLQIIGRTPAARATIVRLRLNNDWLVRARQLWILAGIHPPMES
jgi:hypothetical protein